MNDDTLGTGSGIGMGGLPDSDMGTGMVDSDFMVDDIMGTGNGNMGGNM
jgi:hypothetical protein